MGEREETWVGQSPPVCVPRVVVRARRRRRYECAGAAPAREASSRCLLMYTWDGSIIIIISLIHKSYGPSLMLLSELRNRIFGARSQKRYIPAEVDACWRSRTSDAAAFSLRPARTWTPPCRIRLPCVLLNSDGQPTEERRNIIAYLFAEPTM